MTSQFSNMQSQLLRQCSNGKFCPKVLRIANWSRSITIYIYIKIMRVTISLECLVILIQFVLLLSSVFFYWHKRKNVITKTRFSIQYVERWHCAPALNSLTFNICNGHRQKHWQGSATNQGKYSTETKNVCNIRWSLVDDNKELLVLHTVSFIICLSKAVNDWITVNTLWESPVTKATLAKSTFFWKELWVILFML